MLVSRCSKVVLSFSLVSVFAVAPSTARADFVTKLDCRYEIDWGPQGSPNNPTGQIDDVACPPYTDSQARLTQPMRDYYGQIGEAEANLNAAQKAARRAAEACCNVALGQVWCGAPAYMTVVGRAFMTPAAKGMGAAPSTRSATYFVSTTASPAPSPEPDPAWEPKEGESSYYYSGGGSSAPATSTLDAIEILNTIEQTPVAK